MKIYDLFQLNDLEIKKFLIISFTISISIFILIFDDKIGIFFPFLRALIGFIFLTFIPGFFLLRILKIHDIGPIRSLIFSVLLSITFVMFLGLLINTIYYKLNVYTPISAYYLSATFIVFLVIIGILIIIFDKKVDSHHFLDIQDIFSNYSLFILLIPFLSIIGTYFVNFQSNNIFLIFLIIYICFVVLLISFNKIPEKYYPFAIFSITLALLWHVTLISNYLTGWDVNGEYYYSNLTIINGYWHSGIFGDNNAILSIDLLAPIYSIVTNLDLTWVFKIIYPILFAFVPLSLYVVFENQTNSKIAFFSTLFLIFYNQFYTSSSYKQMIGELFFVALIILITTPMISNQKRAILFVLLGVSLVVSHYALSYIFLLLLLIYLIILFINPKLNKIEKLQNLNLMELLETFKNKLNINYFLFLLVFTLAWYMYISSSSGFMALTTIVSNITGNFVTDFMNPHAVQGQALLLTSTKSILHSIFKYIFIFSNFLITIGLLITLRHDKFKFKLDYLLLAVASFLLLVFSLLVPYFSSSMNTSRIYQISLLVLSPFFLIGFLGILNSIFKLFNFESENVSLKLIAIFLSIFLIFNSGLVFEIFNDDPISISISQKTIYFNGDEVSKAYISQTIYNDQDYYSVKWLSSNGNKSLTIFSDFWHTLLILQSYGMIQNATALYNNTPVPLNSYLYLGSINVNQNILYFSNQMYYKSDETALNTGKNNIIYDNGNSSIILSSEFFKFSINNLYPFSS